MRETISHADGTNGYLTITTTKKPGSPKRTRTFKFGEKDFYSFLLCSFSSSSKFNQMKKEFECGRRVIHFWSRIESKSFSLCNACNGSEFRFGSVNAIGQRNVHNIESIVVEPMENCIKTTSRIKVSEQKCDFHWFLVDRVVLNDLN